MASGVAAESILFIGAIIAATAVAGIITGVAGGLGNEVRIQGQNEADGLRSDVTIINDPGDVESSPQLVLYAKNTGATSLLTGDINVVVDGVLSQALAFDVIESADDETWPPGSVVQVTASDVVLLPGDHRVRLTAGSASNAYFVWSD